MSNGTGRPVQPQRILVRGVNWLGDAVMTTPALQRLREARPGAHLTLLTHIKLAGLWRGHPAVDAVMTFDSGESVFQVARRMRAENFDLALVLPNSPRSALEVFLAGIPERIGGAQPWRNCFLTRLIPARPGAVPMHKRSVAEIKRLITSGAASLEKISTSAHHLHHYLHLVAALGANTEPLAPCIVVDAAEVDAIRRQFQLPGNTPLFGLNPGAEYGPAKRWPRERFIAAAVELQKRTGCAWLILGGSADVELAGAIAAALTHHAPRTTVFNLAGTTSLRELCAVLKACAVVLTNDTGPMHLAAAVGTPVVVPFGSTSPEMTGPGLPGDPRHQLLQSGAVCAPCFLRECPVDFRCMNGISVERVVQAVLLAHAGR